MQRKKAQVWVETVVYTLIGISIIGVLLAVAKPRVDEIRDKLIIEQTIESFNQIHSKILEIQDAPGNQRTLGLKLSRGKIIINPDSDEISWEMGSKYEYSQIGSEIELGKLIIMTQQADPYNIRIILRYPEYNLTLFEGIDNLEIEESPTPYTLIFQNVGGSDRRINVGVK